MPKVKSLPNLRVCGADMEDLRRSGLTEETILAAGLYTEGDALVIPYRDLDGRVNCFARRRPHNPRIGANGRPVKYEQPPGTPARAYYPPASLPLIRDGNVPRYITEGEKKALALSQLELAAIGIGGVWNWKKKGTDDLIDDLAAVPWAGRTVYIVFDRDEKPKTRQQTECARRRLAAALLKAGAGKVLTIDLPLSPVGEKQGVDDFLVAHGEGMFRELIEKAAQGRGVKEIDAMDLKTAEAAQAIESLPVLDREGYIIKRCSNVLSAPPKWGKTRLIYHCLPSWLRMGDTVLLFTEEPEVVWQDRLKTLDIIDQRGLTLVFGLGIEVGRLLDRVREGDESVVVIDTLRGLGVLGDDENDNSEVARSLEPWLTSCRQGEKTFVGLHHDRKAGGKHGQGVSGAHAIVGCVDVLLQLQRGSKDNERLLSALSRLPSPPDLTYRKTDVGTMEAVDAEASPLIELLPDEPPGWTVDEFVKEAHVTKLDALKVLNNAERVVKSGKGVKGDPHRHYRK